MDPLTLFVIGSGLQIAGGLRQSRQESKRLREAAQVSAFNAGLARAQGAQNEAAQRRQAAQFFGEQRAAVVQSGVDPSSGSALDIQRQSEEFSELDAMTIRYESEMRALGLLSQAEDYLGQARDVRRAAPITAAAGLLSSAGQLSYMRGVKATR